MKNIVNMLIVCLLSMQSISAAPFAKWTKTELTLDNGMVKRVIKLPENEGNFVTTLYKPIEGDFQYFQKENTDFQFEINGNVYSGKSGWRLTGIKTLTDNLQGDGAAVTLLSADKKIELTLKFLLYPNLPVIRKSLIVKNLASSEVSLESVDVEKFNVSGYYATTFSWIYSNYGRRKSIGPYEGNMQDALVIVHNMNWEAGIVTFVFADIEIVQNHTVNRPFVGSPCF